MQDTFNIDKRYWNECLNLINSYGVKFYYVELYIPRTTTFNQQEDEQKFRFTLNNYDGTASVCAGLNWTPITIVNKKDNHIKILSNGLRTDKRANFISYHEGLGLINLMMKKLTKEQEEFFTGYGTITRAKTTKLQEELKDIYFRHYGTYPRVMTQFKIVYDIEKLVIDSCIKLIEIPNVNAIIKGTSNPIPFIETMDDYKRITLSLSLAQNAC